MHRYLNVIMTAAILAVLADKLTVCTSDDDESTVDTVDPGDTLG